MGSNPSQPLIILMLKWSQILTVEFCEDGFYAL
jgi:hypothetical protein